jgi:predicted DNA-binding transcriptional regulator AlpA
MIRKTKFLRSERGLRTIKRWIVTKDVGALLHYHTETVYRRVKQEGLPAIRDVRRLKYDPPAIEDWLERRAESARTRAQ